MPTVSRLLSLLGIQTRTQQTKALGNDVVAFSQNGLLGI